MLGRFTPWRVTALLLACLAVLPFWVGEYMPLVDIPQHASQISIAQNWDQAEFGYPREYAVNWYSSQLLAYNLTRAVGLLLPLPYAIKLILSLAVLGLFASVYWLVRSTEGDPWWSLLSFPLGFGFSMYWGMFNYVVAIPLGIVLVTCSIRFATAPSARRALGIAALCSGLFFAHALILAYAGLVSGAVVAFKTVGWRNRLIGCLALVSVLPTVTAWWLIQAKNPSTAETFVDPAIGAYRIWQVLAFQVSSALEPSGDALTGLVLLALPFVLGARPRRELWRWLPLIVTLGVFALAPRGALDIDLIYGRFAVFVLPALLCALEPRAVGPLGRAAASGLVALQLASVAWTFLRFDREAHPLNEMLAHTLPHKRLLYMPVNPASAVVPYEAYSHFGSWYQVKKGGIADFSFAELYPAWYRYRASAEPNLPPEFDSHSDHFRYLQHHGERYDYFLARGPVVPEWFMGAEQHVDRLASAGEWTLFGRVDIQHTASAAE